MRDLTVTVIQTELDWEEVDANLRRFDGLIRPLEGVSDVIVLPEMFTTGFSMNAARLAEDMNGRAVGWLQQTARKMGAAIVGSIIAADEGRYYNRLLWAGPDGSLHAYDKRHLFRYAGEDRVYSAGASRLTTEVKRWKVRPFICYDLRFPVWTRSATPTDLYDVAIFIANWPRARAAHWSALLQARAIENQAYVIGVNRIGTDGSGLSYSGDSSIIDPTGTVMFRCTDAPCVHTERLERNCLDTYRHDFPAWKDADRFRLR